VVKVFLPCVFHAKVVDDKRECDGARRMSPEAGSARAFEVSMGGKAIFEQFVG
jgi:hypothetical protein